MNHLSTLPLSTERLRLRRLTMADAETMYANWASDDRVSRFVTWDTHPDVDETRKILALWTAGYDAPDFYNWGIELDGVLIGNIACDNVSAENESMEVGYTLGFPWWGGGIMTEALGRVTDFLFSEVGARRLYLFHETENPASGRVMQKCGYRHEGTTLESRRGKGDRFVDIAQYAMLRREWESAKASTK